jgi:apolipoprotein N-acyltransferase
MSLSRRVHSNGPPGADACGSRNSRFVRGGLALVSAALLIASLPAPDIGWLGWVALVPLMIAIHELPPTRAAALGLLTGIVGSFGIYGWLFEVPSFDMRHAVLLALYVGAYPAVWSAATAWLTLRHIPLIIAAPSLWLLLDYLRAHAGFLALPWGTLAQTQHRNLALLQVASLIGEHGVTFLVTLGNAALANLILRREQREVLAAGLILAIAHGWGAEVLSTAPQGQTIKVAAIQPNIQIADRSTEAGRSANLQHLEQLTRSVATQRPALIVWPESAIPGDLSSDPQLVERLQDLTDEIEIPLVLGAAQIEKFATGGPEVTIGRRLFNTAYLLQPNEALSEPYRKRVLVPFAEYLPYPGIIPWPEWLAPRVSEMTPGGQAQLFKVTAELSVGTLICWENLFAPLARESVGNGAQLLVQLTNDVWFGRSAAPYQHNLMSIMRAVENRVPIVIASNTGPSQIIDGYGRVLAGVPDLFTAGVTTGSIYAQAGSTLYSARGDLFIPGVFVAWAIPFLWRSRNLIKKQQPLSWFTTNAGVPLRCTQPETCSDPGKTI